MAGDQLDPGIGEAFGRQLGQRLYGETDKQMRVQRLRNAGDLAVPLNNLLDLARCKRPDPVKREECLKAVAHGSAAAWEHVNLLGEYDLSEGKFKDSVGIKPPKLSG